MTVNNPFEDVDVVEGETLADFTVTSGPLVGKRVESCILRNGSFEQVQLNRCLFSDCTFVGCDLTMMDPFDSSFRNVRFERCKLMGIDWTKAYQLTFDVSFEGCVLSYSTFVGMRLRGLHMTSCKANEANFAEADLTEAELSESQLDDSVFLNTVLTRADLSKATGYSIDPTTNTLVGTKMSLEGALRSAALIGIVVPDLQSESPS